MPSKMARLSGMQLHVSETQRALLGLYVDSTEHSGPIAQTGVW